MAVDTFMAYVGAYPDVAAAEADYELTGLAHYQDHGIPEAIRPDVTVMRKPR
jgi:hypothetical protein